MYTSVVAYGNTLLIRERDENGRLKAWKERSFEPSVFIHSKDGEYRDIRGKHRLSKVKTGNLESTKDFLSSYVENSNVKIYGMDNYALQYIQAMYDRSKPFPKSAIRASTLDIEVDSVDGFPSPIEAKGTVTAITLFDSFDGKFHVFGLGAWDPLKSELKKEVVDKVVYQSYKDEYSLLKAFLEYWKNNYPDIITGWNTDGFDLLYLYNRISKILSESDAKSLSPWGFVRDRTFTKFKKKQTEVSIYGINQLDYLKLYRKHTFKMRESYTIDHIASVELKNHTKLKYEGSLHDLYVNNYQRYVDYNINDVDLVLQIDKVKHLLDLVIDVAYFAGVNYDDTFSPVKIWESKIYDYLLKKGVVIPWKSQIEDEYEYQELLGAFVKEAPTGKKWKWVLSFDLTSLYPSIMRQWNLGNDSIVEDESGDDFTFGNMNLVEQIIQKKLDSNIPKMLKENNLCLAANGTLYSNEIVSFWNDLMTELFTERDRSKKKMIEAKKNLTHLKEGTEEYRVNKAIADENYVREQALKVLLNSAYGACGNKYFMFYDLRIAEAVTLTGQAVTQWIERMLNAYLNKLFNTKNHDYVLYIDTDSVYVHCERFVKQFCDSKMPEQELVDFLDNVAKKIRQDVIDPGYEELRDYLNCSKQLMIMKREVIASDAIWKAKKKYTMRILDSEGVRQEDYKIMGLEAISTRTPSFARKGLKEAYKILLTKTNEELFNYIDEFKDKLYKQDVEGMAIGSSVAGLSKYQDSYGNPISGTPEHVAASLAYNRLIKEKGIENIYEQIREGDKMKMVFLKERNPLKSITKVGFLETWPKEFGLDNYIDREKMFERGFLKSLTELCETVGWTTERVNDLSSFFE